MADDTESADADTADEEQEEDYVWVNQSPTSRIEGTPRRLIYADQIRDDEAQNGDTYAVVLDDPKVVGGSLWQNSEKPSDGTMDNVVDDDTSRPTDYRVVDEDDDGANFTEVGGETFLTTGENGPSSYEEADGFDEDRIIVWYNGLSGQRVGRTLDFNGRPFARWTDEGYLIKGLYQAAEGWRENRSQRGEMAKNGKAPRSARYPVLRNRVTVERNDDGDIDDVSVTEEGDDTRVLIDISRAASGRGYRAHVFDADAFEDEFDAVDTDLPTDSGGRIDDEIDSEMEMPYTAAADEVLEAVGLSMRMYTGDGWADKPEGWEPSSTSEVSSFGVGGGSADDGDSADDTFPTAEHEQFITEIVDELAGTGMTPTEAFDGGLDGLVASFEDQFSSVPPTEKVRDEVYARVNHLDPAELDA